MASKEAREATSEERAEWIGTAFMSISCKSRFVLVVLILSSTVKRVVGSFTGPVESSLIAFLLPFSSHVHLPLSLHFHIKVLYFLDQLLVNLFDLLS